MTDVITKVAIGGVEYPFAGGGSSGEEHEFITQEEYEQLTPAQKAEKVYMIKENGVAPVSNQYINSLVSFLSGNPLVEYVDEGDSGHHTGSITVPENASIFEAIFVSTNDMATPREDNIYMFFPIKTLKDNTGRFGYYSSYQYFYYNENDNKIYYNNIYDYDQVIIKMY